MGRRVLVLGVSASALASTILTGGAWASPSAKPATKGQASSATSQAGAMEAARLVREALQAEVAGDVAKRDAALTAAVAADPTNSDARWQSGQVEFDGQWRPVVEVEKLTAADSRWAEYRRLRDSLANDPEAVRQLARWCDKNGLATEARYHWESLLRANLGDVEARNRLNLVAYRGDLYTPEQIEADKLKRKEFDKNLKNFTPVFRRLVRDAAALDASPREAALAKIRAMSDPAAMPALENVVMIDASSKNGPLARLSTAKRDEVLAALNLALVEALDRMTEPEATIDLASYAVLAPWPEVRTRAAVALKTRKPEEYVPLLMGALRSPVEARVDVTAAPDGTVGLTETITEHGPLGDSVKVRDTNFGTDGAARMDTSRSNPAAVLDAHLARAQALAAATQANVENANAAAEERNRRIEEALATALGKKFDGDVEKWWTEWKEYNELAFDESSSAPETSYEFHDYVYHYPQRPLPPPPPSAPNPSSSNAPSPEPRTFAPNGLIEVQSASGRTVTPVFGVHSCFIAGTPVWTQAGPVAIEKIKVGDLVLSQNPNTGELTYKPVLTTTAGNPGKLMRVKFAEETITSTLGHRFWVEGRGWEMAKAIAAPMAVRGLRGPVDFVSSDAVPQEEVTDAYNLVVQDFDTYFVGEHRLLVHDITCPRPTRVLTPGLALPERSRSLCAADLLTSTSR